jgi:hypothetical protein
MVALYNAVRAALYPSHVQALAAPEHQGLGSQE